MVPKRRQKICLSGRAFHNLSAASEALSPVVLGTLMVQLIKKAFCFACCVKGFRCSQTLQNVRKLQLKATPLANALFRPYGDSMIWNAAASPQHWRWMAVSGRRVDLYARFVCTLKQTHGIYTTEAFPTPQSLNISKRAN